jgi:translocation and assembly module TamB
LERLHLVGDDTDFSASGTVQLAGRRQLELRSDGRVNLHLLQSLNPDLMSDGTATFAVGIAGTISRPYLNGQIKISNGSVSHIDLPNGLADINGTLVFNRDRIQIESLTARSGGGKLNFGGWVTYGKTVSFNLTAKGTDIRLRYPPGVSVAANTDLVLAGSLQNSLLSGEVTITKFALNTQFDLALALARSKQPPEAPDPKSPLNNLHFDVHIVSTPQLQVQTSLAKISGDADLRLRGTGTRPVLLGRVNIVEGDIFFGGTKYHMDRGDVIFTNPVRIEPVLDLEATARVRDYDITLGFHGPADKISTTYRSDPPLPVADIINLLALGRTREEQATVQTQAPPNITEAASNAILGQALNSMVSSRVQKLFGVSRIKIDPQVGGPENNPNARLTVEQQVSNNITLTYITDLTRSNQQAIQIEYNVNRNISIIAVRDLNGVLGFDVRIRQRKR